MELVLTAVAALVIGAMAAYLQGRSALAARDAQLARAEAERDANQAEINQRRFAFISDCGPPTRGL